MDVWAWLGDEVVEVQRREEGRAQRRRRRRRLAVSQLILWVEASTCVLVTKSTRWFDVEVRRIDFGMMGQ